jgi:hypothetical protein
MKDVHYYAFADSSYYSRALDDINPEEISSLKALPCMLSHPFSPCFDPKNRRIQEILPIMFAVAIRIMDHIPTPSRILLFDAIGMAIMHGDVSRGKLEEIPGLVRYAMGKEERSLRLAAGWGISPIRIAMIRSTDVVYPTGEPLSNSSSLCIREGMSLARMFLIRLPELLLHYLTGRRILLRRRR